MFNKLKVTLTNFFRIKRYSNFDTIRVVLPELLALAASLVTAICCLRMHQSNDSRNISSTTNVLPVQESLG